MSVEQFDRCSVCRSYMDAEDLFCANCGTENPQHAVDMLPQAAMPRKHSFDCDACGASMSYDASAQALRCPFCGSQSMSPNPDAGVSTRPRQVVPLAVTHEAALTGFREWLGQGFWRPSDAVESARIGEIASVYVPYWVFEAVTDTRWTADSSPAPAGCRGDWYPLQGTHAATYRQILIGGSRVLTPRETESIAPFDLSQAVPPAEIDLDNAIVEEFRVSRKVARPLARGVIERLEQQACQQQVPNRSRNVKVNVEISGMSGRPVLVPVWILAYQYKQTNHRVLINGQTGQLAGSAPFSYRKLVVILMIVGGIAALLGLLIAVLNR